MFMATKRTCPRCALALRGRRLAAAMIAALPGTAAAGWAFMPGVPALAGWAYLLAAGVCGWNATTSSRVDARHGLWLVLALVMLLLAADKPLDWQAWFADMGRGVAHDQGWYDLRRLLQVLVVVALSVAAWRVHGALRRRLGPAWPEYHLVSTAAICAVWFVAVRTLSLHHIDALLALRWQALALGDAIELGLAAGVIATAFAWRRRFVA